MEEESAADASARAGEGVFREQIPEGESAPGREGEEEGDHWKAMREEGGRDLLPDPNPQTHDLPHELPPLETLDVPDTSDRADMERELDRLGQVLVEKLRTFSVECTIGGRTTGPVRIWPWP
jgi:hypothetical protein